MRAAAIINAVPPATPPEAQRLGINGTVNVDVKLDDQGRVLGVDIASSDNAVLNESSLMAAIRSRYRAKVENCVGVPSTYRFIVTYSSRYVR